MVHHDGETAFQACQRGAGLVTLRRDGFCRDSLKHYRWTLRTPRRPPQHQRPDAPENQQRQLREVRDETAAPRLAVRF